jgi:hypothetical protein
VAEANALAIGVSGLGVSGLLRRYGKKLKIDEVLLVVLGIAGVSWLLRWLEKSKSEVGTLGIGSVVISFTCGMYLSWNLLYINSGH